jgi:hypothetical protein
MNANAKLREALEGIVAMESEIQTLREQASGIDTELTASCISPVELSDAQMPVDFLNKIGRLQTIATIIARRLPAREQALAEAEAGLQGKCEQYAVALSREARSLEAKTQKQVEAELRPHVQDPALFLRAVEQSDKLKEVYLVTWPVKLDSNPINGARVYAEALIKAAGEIEALQKAL